MATEFISQLAFESIEVGQIITEDCDQAPVVVEEGVGRCQANIHTVQFEAADFRIALREARFDEPPAKEEHGDCVIWLSLPMVYLNGHRNEAFSNRCPPPFFR